VSPSLTRVDFPKNNLDEAWFVFTSILKLNLDTKVMPPTVYSELLASELPDLIDSNTVALDLGCGTGFLSMVISKCGAKEVFASDINECAVELARYNFARNGFSGVKAFQSDMFSAFEGKKFSLIASNPPFLPVAPNRCNNESPDGRDVIDRLISESGNFLQVGGKLVFTHSSLAGIQKTESLLEENKFNWRILAKHRLEFRLCTLENLGFVLNVVEQNNGEYIEENDKYLEYLYIICATLRD